MQSAVRLLVRIVLVLVAVWLVMLAVTTSNGRSLERAIVLVLAALVLAAVARLHRRPV